MKTTFILGAGFSYDEGIPLQSQVMQKLLEKKLLNNPTCKFLRQRFGRTTDAELKNVSLEDAFALFNEIPDLPYKRELEIAIAKLFNCFYHRTDKNSYKSFARILDNDLYTVITFNWDIVLDNYILDRNPKPNLDYGYPSKLFSRIKNNEGTLVAEKNSANKALLLKLHGSFNWIYCEKCDSISYVRGEKIAP